MSNKDIWVVFTKSEAQDGCPIDIDASKFYFAEAFVPFDGNQEPVEAINGILTDVKQALLEKKLALSDVSKCMCYVPDEWSGDSEMDKEIRQVAQIADRDSQITFNTFRSQEIQEDCIYAFQVRELNY